MSRWCAMGFLELRCTTANISHGKCANATILSTGVPNLTAVSWVSKVRRTWALLALCLPWLLLITIIMMLVANQGPSGKNRTSFMLVKYFRGSLGEQNRVPRFPHIYIAWQRNHQNHQRSELSTEWPHGDQFPLPHPRCGITAHVIQASPSVRFESKMLIVWVYVLHNKEWSGCGRSDGPPHCILRVFD